MNVAMRHLARVTLAVLMMTLTAGAQVSAAPTITRVNPDVASVGEEIRIRGTNLVGVTSVVFTGGARAKFIAENPTRIRVTVPAGAKTGPVTLTTQGGKVASPSVTINAGLAPGPGAEAPTVTGIEPATAAVGDQVTIRGRNFLDVTGIEFTGGATVRFRVMSATEVRATVPDTATTGPVAVVTRSGRTAGRVVLTVVPRPPAGNALTIGSVSPATGKVGDRIDIAGTAFVDVRRVQFNGVDAQFTVRSDTLIRATVPAGATTGPVRVETGTGQARSRLPFTVAAPVQAPVVLGLTPTRGGPGDSVRIDGRGFIDVKRVELAGVPAEYQVVSETRIRMTVPRNARTGPVTVVTGAGRGQSGANFELVPAVVPPTIDRLNPDRGAIGDSVAIVGSSFTNVRRVEFGGVSAPHTVVSDTRIRATVPFGATTGRVTVVTNDGRATSPGAFTVLRPALSTLQFATRSVSVNASDRRLDVVVTREGDTAGRASVEYAARDRGAIFGRDYRLRSGRLDFAPGERRKVIPVDILEGRAGPAYRDFEITLRNPRDGAQLGNPATTIVTIVDDLTSGAVLEVRESTLDFGRLRIGESARRTVSVRNAGRGTLSFEVDMLGGGEGFALVQRPQRTRLSAGETATFAIEFRPRWRTGRFSGSVVIRSNAGDRSVALRGESLGERLPVVSLQTTAVDFGAVRAGDRATWPVTIRNVGFGQMRILDARIGSGGSAGFYVATRPTRIDLGPWESSTLFVGFNPTGYGSGLVYGTLRIDTTAGVVTVFLQADRRAEPYLVIEPRSLDFGEVEPNDEAIRDLTIINDGDAPLRASVRLRSGEGVFFIEGARDLTVEPRGSRTISVGFAPGSSSGFTGNGSIEIRSRGGDAVVPLYGSVRATVPAPTDRPFLAIDEPASGEALTAGEASTIRFSAWSERGYDGFDVTYSLDGGLTYPYRVGEAGADVRAIVWNVPDTLQTSRARVRVAGRDLAGNVAEAESDLIAIRPANPLLRVDLTIEPGSGGQVPPPAWVGYEIWRVTPDEDTAPDVWDPGAIDTVELGRTPGKAASLVAYDVYRYQAYDDSALPAADDVAGNPENLIGTIPAEDGVYSDVLSTVGPGVTVYAVVCRYDTGDRSRASRPIVVRLPALLDPRFENGELTMAADGSFVVEDGAVLVVDGRDEFRVRLDRRGRFYFVQDIDRSVTGSTMLQQVLRPGRTAVISIRNPDGGESAPVNLVLP